MKRRLAFSLFGAVAVAGFAAEGLRVVVGAGVAL